MLKLIRRHTSPYWYVRGTVAGRRYDESTGLTDKALAESYRAKREWELSHASVFGERGHVTFAQACASYLEHARDERFVGQLLEHFQTIQVSAIDQRAVEQAARAIFTRKTPSAATLVRQLYTPLSAILNHAASMGWCDAPDFRRPKLPPGKTRYLTHEEGERLIRACVKRQRHLRALVTFFLYTGARTSEALALEWRDVDLERRQVVFHDTKNGEARGVPLHARVVAELTALPHRVGRVFLNKNGKPYSIQHEGSPIGKSFATAVKAAGCEPLSPHDLRHTWATWFYQATRDLTALKKLGGWKTTAMVFRYTHANTSEFTADIDRLPSDPWGENGEAADKTNKKLKSVK